MMKKIVFISSVNSPKVLTSSTDIMTNLLLEGLAANDFDVLFVAICEKREQKDDIQTFYRAKGYKTVVLNGFFSGKQNKYKYFFRLFRHGFSLKQYKKRIMVNKELELFSPDLIISHCGVYETTLFGRAMKSLNKNSLYFQYWSDPMTLSGITPDLVKKKPTRWVYYHFEKKALLHCDRVIYGTEPLKHFQGIIFPKLRKKFFYIDIPYAPNTTSADLNGKQNNRFLYSGNYFKRIRNIEPLLNAFANNPKFELDIYGDGDIKADSCSNVFIHGRILSEEMRKIESDADNIICLLNSNCIQIPGKIFYSINLKANIFVIVDGKYADVIAKYLNKFGRFILCENNEMEISKKLFSPLEIEDDYTSVLDDYSPNKIATDLVGGGYK